MAEQIELTKMVVDYKARIERGYLQGLPVLVCEPCLTEYYERKRDTVFHFAGLKKEKDGTKPVWLEMAPIEIIPGKRYDNFVYRPCPSHNPIVDEDEISGPRKVLEALVRVQDQREGSD